MVLGEVVVLDDIPNVGDHIVRVEMQAREARDDRVGHACKADRVAWGLHGGAGGEGEGASDGECGEDGQDVGIHFQ